MKISKHISKGTQHKVFCEDFLIDEVINKNYRIFGVFDGCSSGKDSHFASALIGKIVVSVAREIADNNQFVDLKEIVYQTIISVNIVCEQMKTDVNELLSTMIIMLVNLDEITASIVVIGDGLLAVNQEIINIDQNNQPDYLAYHLSVTKNYDDFDEYYAKLLKFNEVKIDDITISTDGINSFLKRENPLEEKIDIVKYFVQDTYLQSNKAMLARKYNIVRKKHGFENLDDFAIIRIIKS